MKQTIVATPVALRLNFRAGTPLRGYPGSLMGSLSYIKQVFSDTQHYTAAKALYTAAPLGLERPTYDRTLEAPGDGHRGRYAVPDAGQPGARDRPGAGLAGEYWRSRR